MVQPNELRIGNYYKPTDGSGDFKKVTASDLMAWSMGAVYGHYIPLTSEILERFGFDIKDDNPKQKQHYEGDVLFAITISPYTQYEFTNSMTPNGGFVCYQLNEGKVEYKYLHQLQNLILDLTDKELEIKTSNKEMVITEVSLLADGIYGAGYKIK